MKKCIAFLLPFFFVTFLKSQNTKIGVFYARNFSAQTYFNPQKPEDGSIQTSYLNSFGATAFLEKRMTKSLWFRSEVGYRGKGDKKFFQTTISTSPDLVEINDLTKVHYLSGEISSVYYFEREQDYVPYLLTGLNFNYLTGIQYDSQATLIDQLPATLLEKAESQTFGFHFGAGMKVANAILLDGRLTRETLGLVFEYGCGFELSF